MVAGPSTWVAPSIVAAARDRVGAVFAPHDQLGDQRVVVRRDLVAFLEAGIDADAVAGREAARG